MTAYKSVHVIPDILARGAADHPDKDAYRFDGQGLSYGALATRASKLTRVLLDLGVARGDRVGIFLNQSLELPVAVYGILGAGAGFVPIDPMAPKARVEQIVSACGIRVIVSDTRKASVLGELVAENAKPDIVIGANVSGTQCVSWAEVDQATPAAPVSLTEQDLAYIMFTSGSTGAPKGMVHTHANGLIYADNLRHYHDLHADDRFLNLSPLHFDMAIMDHVSALMVGATTIIVPESTARLPASLTALAAREKASIWYSVPFAMTEMLLKGGMDQHDLTGLRWMIYGGEVFPLKHLRALQTALPAAKFCNAYGPAETHQVSSFDIDPLPDDEDYVIPIGKPWRTVQALIVDDDDRPVPPGEPGELLVRAPSCMRGYWGDQIRTAAAFHDRPVDGVITDRYYRTGDIVVMMADGMMYFHGRKDRQIKIRGNRVELDEIEAILLDHPDVTDCAVIKSRDGRQLVATVTTRSPDTGPAALRAHCRKRLPPYAVPSSFVEIEDYPRTSSLKIDRNALLDRLEPAE